MPPRWLAAANGRAATHTPDPAAARPRGELPRWTVRSTRPVRGSMRSSVASNSSLTHSASLAATMPLGPSPTPMVAVTVPVAGSSFETVRSSELATHTAARGDRDARRPGTDGHRAARLAGGRVDPLDRAVLAVGDPDGAGPGRDAVRAPADLEPLFVTSPVAGSIRSTVSSPSLATHTPLGPLAMATGRLPTWIVSTALLAAVLIRDTVPSPLLVTHTSGPVTATALGAEPTGICCTTAWVAGLIRASVPSVLSTAQTDPSP